MSQRPHRLLPGWVRCPTCTRQLRLRNDGALPGHRPVGKTFRDLPCPRRAV